MVGDIQSDVESVQTYAQAKAWLWRHVDPIDMEAVCVRYAPLSPVMRFVCALFWVSEFRLRADLRRTWFEVSR